MELRSEPFGFSELIGLRVCNQAGRSLGHVFEAKAHWEEDGSIVIDELLVGRRALLRRLHGPGSDARGIPWGAVAEVADDHIVVRALNGE
jgi:sporulation protein YlmC with PRC-barrel domain